MKEADWVNQARTTRNHAHTHTHLNTYTTVQMVGLDQHIRFESIRFSDGHRHREREQPQIPVVFTTRTHRRSGVSRWTPTGNLSSSSRQGVNMSSFGTVMVLRRLSYLGAWARAIRTNIWRAPMHGHADAAKGALVLAPGGPVGIAGAPAGGSTPTVIAAAFKDASAQTCTTMT